MCNSPSDTQWQIEALDREIAHYRKRAGQIYFFGFLLEVMILGGKESIQLGDIGNLYIAIIYTILFLSILAAAYYFGDVYWARISNLKKNRSTVLTDAKLTDMYQGETKNEIKSLSWLLLCLSLAGIVIIWLNFLNPQPASTSELEREFYPTDQSAEKITRLIGNVTLLGTWFENIQRRC